MCVSCPFNSVSTGNNSQKCDDCSNETYSNDANTQCLPKVPDIFDYNSKTAVALSVLCILGSTASVASGLMFYWKRDTPLVMASSKTHSYAIAAALALGFQTVFFYIGYPTDISCKLKSIVAGLHVTFIISVFCAKLYIIRKLFNANVVTSSKKWFYKSWFAVCILTCLHFIYNIIYESLDPSEVVKDFSYIRILPVFCKTSDTKFLTVSIFQLILSTVCSIFSFRARLLPKRFQDTRLLWFIMFTMCIMLCISTSAHFLLGSSTRTQTIDSIFILVLNYLILVMYYIPKLYIIFFKPIRNTRPIFMNKFYNRKSIKQN
ncbi:G-protein coupled receptor family C group 6 member A-like [Anneissia japonica]|uniref:G-protein coupled receptor family C group 6 member A-like n=1 Tax=Anneissia japonica TaxID=1529436 RepID=UPI0014258AD6|nr:G-protein coupled receptor family C group 6 member A-like [Anneissia japonica]